MPTAAITPSGNDTCSGDRKEISAVALNQYHCYQKSALNTFLSIAPAFTEFLNMEVIRKKPGLDCKVNCEAIVGPMERDRSTMVFLHFTISMKLAALKNVEMGSSQCAGTTFNAVSIKKTHLCLVQPFLTKVVIFAITSDSLSYDNEVLPVFRIKKLLGYCPGCDQ